MVVGAGMASVRLVEGLVARGLGDRVTVVGEERHAPYNRVLLSAVLEGSHRPGALTLRGREWYADHGFDLRLGARASEVDRGRRTVVLADGQELPYDRLVLATGSVPTLPPIRGLVGADGTLHRRVHAFRGLDDCARLLDALPLARSAVVVGGGLLGLQVARALSVRGLRTEVVEGGDHLLRSHVDEKAGAVLTRSLRRLGTEVYLGARAVRFTDAGLQLDNGYALDADLVIVCAGGRPNVGLARRTGLTVGRGIVVDDRLRSVDDPQVYAVGDCAEVDGHSHGFVAPAWAQAEVVAAHLGGEQATYDGHRLVARLRATDLEVAVLGDPLHETGEVVEVANPLRGAYRRIVVRDGRIVAGALVGDLSRIGVITQAFDRGTVLGTREAGALLLPEQVSTGSTNGEGSADALPDDAEVCACAGVSAGRIRACGSLAEARETTRATTGCGGCAATVEQLLTRVKEPEKGAV